MMTLNTTAHFTILKNYLEMTSFKNNQMNDQKNVNDIISVENWDMYFSKHFNFSTSGSDTQKIFPFFCPKTVKEKYEGEWIKGIQPVNNDIVPFNVLKEQAIVGLYLTFLLNKIKPDRIVTFLRGGLIPSMMAVGSLRCVCDYADKNVFIEYSTSSLEETGKEKLRSIIEDEKVKSILIMEYVKSGSAMSKYLKLIKEYALARVEKLIVTQIFILQKDKNNNSYQAIRQNTKFKEILRKFTSNISEDHLLAFLENNFNVEYCQSDSTQHNVQFEQFFIGLADSFFDNDKNWDKIGLTWDLGKKEVSVDSVQCCRSIILPSKNGDVVDLNNLDFYVWLISWEQKTILEKEGFKRYLEF